MLIPLSKPTGCVTPRVNPNVNQGLWVRTTCQRALMNQQMYPLGQHVDSGEVVGVLPYMGAVLSAQLCCKPRTSLKIKSVKKIFKKCMSFITKETTKEYGLYTPTMGKPLQNVFSTEGESHLPNTAYILDEGSLKTALLPSIHLSFCNSLRSESVVQYINSEL